MIVKCYLKKKAYNEQLLRQGMTRQDIATTLNISINLVRGWEYRKFDVKSKYTAKLLEILDIANFDTLFDIV